jgi:Ca2+-transporting ATPase
VLRAALVEIPIYCWIFLSRVDDLEDARTMLFFAFVAVEMVIALNCRSLRFSIFKVPPHGWLLLALTWELILVTAIVQIASVRDAFGIGMPTASGIATISLAAIFVFLAIEASKYLMRRTWPSGQQATRD